MGLDLSHGAETPSLNWSKACRQRRGGYFNNKGKKKFSLKKRRRKEGGGKNFFGGKIYFFKGKTDQILWGESFNRFQEGLSWGRRGTRPQKGTHIAFEERVGHEEKLNFSLEGKKGAFEKKQTWKRRNISRGVWVGGRCRGQTENPKKHPLIWGIVQLGGESPKREGFWGGGGGRHDL